MQFSSGLKHELYRHWPAGTLEFAYCRTTKPDTSLSCGELSLHSSTTYISTSLLNPRTVCGWSPHYPGSAPQTTKSNWRIYRDISRLVLPHQLQNGWHLSNVFIGFHSHNFFLDFPLNFPPSHLILIPLCFIISLMLSILWSWANGKLNGSVWSLICLKTFTLNFNLL